MPLNGFLLGDLPQGDLAALQGGGVAGVYDAGPVEAVFAELSLPVAAADRLHEAADDGEVPLARLYLGQDHGRFPAFRAKSRARRSGRASGSRTTCCTTSTIG